MPVNPNFSSRPLCLMKEDGVNLCCPSVLTPCSCTHTDTRQLHIHFAQREHRFRRYFCFTAAQTGSQRPKDHSPLACIYMHTQTYAFAHSPSLYVYRPVCDAWVWKHICVALSLLFVTCNKENNR